MDRPTRILKPVPGILSLILSALLGVAVPAADWKPAASPLVTRWTKDVLPEKAHLEYPRPQLQRGDWEILNGLWDYAIRPRDDAKPSQFDGKILVPFPVESALSGVMKRVGPDKRLWYRRTIFPLEGWRGKRVLLHFEAVDWEATVSIDGREVGSHRGGYTPFTFDVTDVAAPGKSHELVVSVWDPSDAGTQPCGKQHNKPEGIWYTPSTGIWQTVWLEPVPQTYVRNLRFEPDFAEHQVKVYADVAGPTEGCTVRAALFWTLPRDESGATTRRGVVSGDAVAGRPFTMKIPPSEVRPWTPESPSLYDVSVQIYKNWEVKGASVEVVDALHSYCALRSISVVQEPDKTTRIRLNGKPIFLIGPLDQGFWPDGLYTAPTDEALRNDLEVTKKLGFNLIRKHVKVEPARWYYWCDRLGLLVLQDMPNGDAHAPEESKQHPEIRRSAQSARQFETELAEMIDSRRQFPCIIGWVPFNEGWGQYDTVKISRWIKEHDPIRIVIPASGWNDFPVGDVHDIHAYPGPAAPPASPVRAAVLGEFGGLGLPVPGHLWTDKKNWGYRKYKDPKELTAAYVNLATKLRPLVASRLSAAVYTQTTDVETEVNGLMTYDREQIKMDAEQVRAANTELVRLLDEVGSKKHE